MAGPSVRLTASAVSSCLSVSTKPRQQLVKGKRLYQIIVRAGIQVTPKGQWEAGRVLGLSRTQTFVRVVLPPALQRIYPALVSQCIIVMLGSSVVSQVSYEELTFAANLIQSRTFLSFEVYLVTTGIYLALSIAMRQLLMAAGRKWLGVQA